MNKKIFLLVFILLILPLALAANTEYNITTLSSCEGYTLIKIRGNVGNVSDEILMPLCEVSDNIWNCSCDGETLLNMSIKENVINEYDIVVQYQFDKDKESLRSLEFNNIKINTNPKTNCKYASIKKWSMDYYINIYNWNIYIRNNIYN